jgi:transposase InsO family protein
MESTIGLFKTELIKPQRPWKTLSQVELATAEWVDWYNHRRLHGEIGHVHSLRSLPNPGRFTGRPESGVEVRLAAHDLLARVDTPAGRGNVDMRVDVL